MTQNNNLELNEDIKTAVRDKSNGKNTGQTEPFVNASVAEKANNVNSDSELEIDNRPLYLRKKPNTEQQPEHENQIIEHVKAKKYSILKLDKKEGILIKKEISNFILEPIKTIEDEDGIKSVFNIVTRAKTYKNFTIKNKKLFGNDFIKELKQVNKGLRIDVKSIDYVLEFVNDAYEKTVQGTHKTGFVGGYFVTTTQTYDKNLKPVNDVLSYTNDNEYITTDIMKAKQITKNELEIIIKPLFNYNTPYKTISIISFIVSCFINQKLFDNDYKIPLWALNGASGSGKSTTLENVFQPIFSAYKSVGAEMTTKFSLLKNANSSNLIPMVLDEYKTIKMKQTQINMLSAFFRSMYDKHTAERGQTDQRVQELTMTSPLIVVGESQTSENALKERFITLEFIKKDIQQKNIDNMSLLIKNKKLLNNLGYTMLKYFLKLDNINTDAIEEHKERLTNISISRQKNSYSILVYCYSLFADMINQYGLKLPYTVDEVIEIFNQSYKETADEKSELIKTLELFDLMASNKAIQSNIDYDLDLKNNILSLDVKQIYLKLGKFLKDFNILDINHLTQNIFTKSLGAENYFIGYKATRINERVTKCYKIDLNILSRENIDLSTFISDKSISDCKIVDIAK